MPAGWCYRMYTRWTFQRGALSTFIVHRRLGKACAQSRASSQGRVALCSSCIIKSPLENCWCQPLWRGPLLSNTTQVPCEGSHLFYRFL